MIDFHEIVKFRNDAEQLAEYYLAESFKGRSITYPINPFQMLVDEGLEFLLRDFGKLEGVFIPAEDPDDIPIVGININRPITRQRFTAAHELCHFLKGAQEQYCPIGKKNKAEWFADRFASALLMPLPELKEQVKQRIKDDYVNFDDILEIADFFGVSFESCAIRVNYCTHTLQGNTELKELRKQIKKYKPEAHRKLRGFHYVVLFEQLIDNYKHGLSLPSNAYASYVFQNNYIYNDSRMEGVDIEQEAAAEIVSDLRLKMQNSQYCKEENEAFLSVAGHSEMYSSIFEMPMKNSCSVFDIMTLHNKLYSFYPYPEYGGKFRVDNTMVLGAKIEPIPPNQIVTELLVLDQQLHLVFERRKEIKISEFIKESIIIHHKLTVIHPFPDGNGRVIRAFLNLMMVRNNLTPVYVKVEDKQKYIDALLLADKENDYSALLEFFYFSIIRASVELSR
ncbi:ImmA/IrrE family metallo-endopeptidase [Proteiniclasticum sp. QWL-01]|uniref:ImmA/IrrE family metallo-endopeptidase n=1 Tax=Proteiniclasticum sp. QWL-01 TaxID=3036945 RepID=UPI002410EAD6|nr:ImmA/IrrE family metallo-endopeptidase [Proteiniclasticum sp. QWL-01]WFF74377.1 ImmA/IrrE family metallo-endopeptidase [Proteiniclasticum sp. QWL-01]